MTVESIRHMRDLSAIIDENPDVAEFLLTGKAAEVFVRRVYGRHDRHRGDVRGVREGECGNVRWEKVDMR